MPFRSLVVLLVASCCLLLSGKLQAQFDDFPFGGENPFGQADTPKLFVSAQVDPPTETGPAMLTVTAEIEPGWYIYSLTQSPGGPRPSKISLTDSEQYRLAGPFVADPGPEISEQPEIWPNLPIEEHRGRVTWKAPLRLAEGVDAADLEISGSLYVQACSADTCLDQNIAFRSGAAPPQGATAGLPGSANSTAWADSAAWKEGDERFAREGLELTGRLTTAAARPGDALQLRITATPDVGWHVYALDMPEAERTLSSPSHAAVVEATGLEVGTPQADQEYVEKHHEFPAGAVDRYYRGPVTWSIPITVPAETAPGEYLLQGVVGYQVCADDESSCRQPAGARFAVKLFVNEDAPTDAGAVRFVREDYATAARLARAVHSGAPAEVVAATESSDEPVAAAASPRRPELTLAVALPLALVGGFILNFMPCVLPVIGLKVMAFIHQSGKSQSRIFFLNLWYVLGIISLFMVLACLAAFLNFGWAEQFQNPYFGIVLASIIFVFALSMLGVWEIPIPGFVGAGKAAEMANQTGYSGAFLKGVLTTVLATPCVGPFVIPVTVWAAAQSQATIFLVFFMMGLGMASPFLMIGLFPKLVSWLPKPGAWMDTFKQIMGFVLLGTTVFVFAIVPGDWRVPTLALLFALWAACWWIGRVPLTADFWPKARAWGAAALFAAVTGFSSFALADFLQNRDSEVWRTFSPDTLQTLREEQRPVLIDFTATWCLTCQTNKFSALYTGESRRFMQQHGIVGLTADKTEPAPEIDRLLAELGNTSGGIPFYAVYPTDGGEPILLDGILTQRRLLAALQQAVGGETVRANRAADLHTARAE